MYPASEFQRTPESEISQPTTAKNLIDLAVNRSPLAYTYLAARAVIRQALSPTDQAVFDQQQVFTVWIDEITMTNGSVLTDLQPKHPPHLSRDHIRVLEIADKAHTFVHALLVARGLAITRAPRIQLDWKLRQIYSYLTFGGANPGHGEYDADVTALLAGISSELDLDPYEYTFLDRVAHFFDGPKAVSFLTEQHASYGITLTGMKLMRSWKQFAQERFGGNPEWLDRLQLNTPVNAYNRLNEIRWGHITTQGSRVVVDRKIPKVFYRLWEFQPEECPLRELEDSHIET